jgi:hypothetical protein
VTDADGRANAGQFTGAGLNRNSSAFPLPLTFNVVGQVLGQAMPQAPFSLTYISP